MDWCPALICATAGVQSTSAISLNSRHCFCQPSPPFSEVNKCPYLVPATICRGFAGLKAMAQTQELGCCGSGSTSQLSAASWETRILLVEPGVPSEILRYRSLCVPNGAFMERM